MTTPRKKPVWKGVFVAGTVAGVLGLVGLVFWRTDRVTGTHYTRTRFLPLREWGFGIANARGFFIPTPIKNNTPTIVETRSWDGSGDWQVTRQTLVVKRLPKSVQMSTSPLSTTYSSSSPSIRSVSESQAADIIITARPDVLGARAIPSITLSHNAFGATVLPVPGNLQTRKLGFLAVDTCPGISVQ